MAHGRTSQAVGVNGQLVEYRYDGTVKNRIKLAYGQRIQLYELGSVQTLRLRGR